VRRLPLLALACLLLAGCVRPASSEFSQSRQPLCQDRGEPGTQVVVLMAQAVPSASLLPCVKLLPAGWSVSDSPIGDVTLALSFISRDAVRNRVRHSTDGRAELDPQ